MTMTTMLVSVAELSNIFSVFAVLVCFCAMILFITRNMMVLRVHGDDMVFPRHHPHILHHGVPPGAPPPACRIPQMHMMKVHIPFTFKLLETSKSTYAALRSHHKLLDIIHADSHIFIKNAQIPGVQCTVSSQIRYSIRAFWGVGIRELHAALWKPWPALQDPNLLTGHHQRRGDHTVRGPHSDEPLALSLPCADNTNTASPLQLGTPPRLAYPLVVFLVRADETPGELHPDETVALVSVVHIRDAVCTLPTAVLAQYLKQANGQLSCLKQLYLATGNPVGCDDDEAALQVATAVAPHEGLALAEPVTPGGQQEQQTPLLCTAASNAGGGVAPNGATSAADIHCTNATDTVEQLCVVCQYFPLSRALLPCRHTCICASCFGKLERCPMCRSPIKSYFCIRGEEYMPHSGKVTPPTTAPASNPSAIQNWIDSWNDRLTDFLGFGR